MAERRSRRTFSEKPPAGLYRTRDVDATESAMLVWTLIAGSLGFVMGGFLAVFVANMGAPGWVAVLCVPFGAVFTGGLTRLLVGGSAGAASTIYNPSGRSTPRRKEHSHAESLAARGQYEEAVTAFELAVAEDPADPWPYLRVARIYRDQLARLEDSARWFRRAFREATDPPVIARKELVELYVHRLGEPARAAPELARMAEELAGTPEGEWAATELLHVKQLMGQAADEA